MRKFSIIMGCLAALWCAVPAAAEDAGLADLSLEQLMDVKVVSASRRSEDRAHTPATVTVISSDDIRRFGYRTIAEALASVPGFYSSNDRNYKYLGVRGFGRPGDYNTRVLFLLNGHRLNDANYDYAGVANDLGVDMESIDRLEVVKGPGSSLWGSNALLSVVNIITKTGEQVHGTTLTGEAGNQYRTRGLAQYGTRTNGGLDVYSSVSGAHANGQGNIFFPEYDSPATNYGVSHDNDDESWYRGLMTASYEGLTFMLNANNRKKTIPTGAFGTVFNDHGNYTADSETRAELRYDTVLDPASEDSLTVRMYLDREHYHGNYVLDFEGVHSPNDDKADGNTEGFEVLYSRKIIDGLSATLGSELRHAFDLRLYNADYYPTTTVYVDETSAFTQSSVFGQLEAEPASWVSVVAGLRFDHYSSDIQEVNPRAGVILRPLSDTTLKLLYGAAFRAPNNYEMNYQSQAQGYARNPNLGSETLDSYEVAVEQKIAKHHFVTLSAYHFKMDDLIDQTTRPDGLIWFENLSGATSRGLELQYLAQFQNSTKIVLAGSYGDGESDPSGVGLDNSPHGTVFGGAYFPLWEKLLFVSPQYQWIGPRTSYQQTDIPSSRVVNLVLTSEPLEQRLSLSLGVYNLLNERNYSSGAAEHLEAAIPQNSRTLLLKAGWHF